jgi:hypothetical protein
MVADNPNRHLKTAISESAVDRGQKGIESDTLFIPKILENLAPRGAMNMDAVVAAICLVRSN